MPTKPEKRNWYAVKGMLLFRKHGAGFALIPRGNGLFAVEHLAEGYALYLEDIERRREAQREEQARARAQRQKQGPPSAEEVLRLAAGRSKRRQRNAQAKGDAAAAAEHAGRAEELTARRCEAPARSRAGLAFLLQEAGRRLRAADPRDRLLQPLNDVRADVERCPYDPLFPAMVDRVAETLARRGSPQLVVQKVLENAAASLRKRGPKFMRLTLEEYRPGPEPAWKTKLPHEYVALRPSEERMRRLAHTSIRDA